PRIQYFGGTYNRIREVFSFRQLSETGSQLCFDSFQYRKIPINRSIHSDGREKLARPSCVYFGAGFFIPVPEPFRLELKSLSGISSCIINPAGIRIFCPETIVFQSGNSTENILISESASQMIDGNFISKTFVF